MERFFEGNLPLHRTPEGKAYEAYFDRVKKYTIMYERKYATRLTGKAIVDAKFKEYMDEMEELNSDLLAMKDITGGPAAVHQNTVLEQLSVMYRNDEFIGRNIMPTIFTGGALSGVYFNYEKRDRLAYPDDSMRDRTQPNELNQNRSKSTYSLQPRSLVELLDWLIVQNQSAPLNEVLDLTANVLNGLEFNAEIRIATAVQNASNYGGNTGAVAAADRFDTATGGDPAGVVDAGKAACWGGSGPGEWVISVSILLHNVLKRHPRILDSFKYSGALGDSGFVSRKMLAEYFEVDKYIVGAARKDTANIGQTASFSRIWGNSLAISRVSTQPSLRNAAFGYSLQDNSVRTELFWMPDEGASGMYKARATMSDQQLVIAPTSSYLVTTPMG